MPTTQVFNPLGNNGKGDFDLVSTATGGTGQSWEVDRTPVEAPDGTRTLFTLPSSNTYVASYIVVYLNGQQLTHTNDFTETSSTTITFIAIPLTGDIIRLNYRTT